MKAKDFLAVIGIILLVLGAITAMAYMVYRFSGLFSPKSKRFIETELETDFV